MRDVFLADAHLRHPSDENYRRLLSFLAEQRGRTRTLYLLGDIFSFWVGYRNVVFSAYVPVLEALRKLREGGTQIVYVEGNHDFHLGPYFRDVLGSRILPDGGAVDLDGLRISIEHGDLINPKDAGYRLWRRVLRSLPLRMLMRLAPPDLTWAIADWADRQSAKKHAAKRKRWIPREMLLEHASRRFAEGYGATVTGHFHVPLLEESNGRTLLAVGDWIEQYSYAVWENGKFGLYKYQDSEVLPPGS